MSLEILEAKEAIREVIDSFANLGRNMAYFLKCQEAARSVGIPLPEQEAPVFTNFVRE